MTESFLQYVWHHKLLEGGLTTVDGQPVIVERAGDLNRDAGPDFLDARLSIGGIQWAGNVEVHIKASDWNLHHHSQDKAYNNVVLHVVYVYDADVILENGRKLPTVEITDAIPDHVWRNYEELMQSASTNEIPCAPRIKETPTFLFHTGQDRLLVERLQRKSDDVERLLKSTRGNWEQTCYQLVAHYFGGKTNGFPFELLAKVTPMRVLAKIKDNPFRVEALFFGQAGMLNGIFFDDYPNALQREYNYLAAAHNLTPMQAHLWKFFRMRPVSFPTLRISQFAALISQSSNLFSKLLETKETKVLHSYFDVQASDYWQSHYQFDKPIDDKALPTVKRLGINTIDTILINAWVPLLFKYGQAHDDESLKEQALTILHNIRPESNRIVRLWQSAGVEPADAADTQALLQRYNEYCSHKRCLDCSLAFRLIRSAHRIRSSSEALDVGKNNK